MWNIEEIKTKKRKVIERLKKCNDEKEKETLSITLASYICMLENSGTIRYTKFYNLMDKLTKGKFSLIKSSNKVVVKIVDMVYAKKDYMDKEYLSFLIELSKNVANTEKVIKDYSGVVLEKFNLDNDALINFSKLFYLSLGDKEIETCANKILYDITSLNFGTEFLIDYEYALGLTFYDFVYNKVYCTTVKNENLFDLQANNHEIMHGIDFYMQPKILTENYYGFHEVPTYSIDYLFIDYLETLGLDKNEIQKLRLQKDFYLQCLAANTIDKIRRYLFSLKNISYFSDFTIEDVMVVLNFDILKNLIEIEAGVIAYGLSRQFEENYEEGILNLKTFMKTIIPKDKKPDFSNIGLSDDVLRNLSFEIGSYSRKHQEKDAKVK